jgi:hypothetical protein
MIIPFMHRHNEDGTDNSWFIFMQRPELHPSSFNPLQMNTEIMNSLPTHFFWFGHEKQKNVALELLSSKSPYFLRKDIVFGKQM